MLIDVIERIQLEWSKLRSSILDLWFNLRLWTLSVRYHGEANIPPEKLKALLGESIDGFITVAICVFALNSVCRRLKLSKESLRTTEILQAIFNLGDGLAPKDAQCIDQLMASPTKRRDVLEMLIENKDIRREFIAFQISDEDRLGFERWLDADDATIHKEEPKTPK